MAEVNSTDRRVACQHCQTLYLPNPKNTVRRFCSVECHAARTKPVAPSVVLNLTPGTMGAVSEIYICYALMVCGWHVFRSQSPNSPVDLVAIKEGEPMRLIEVRTGALTPQGARVFGHNVHDPRLATEIAVFYPESGEVEFHLIDSDNLRISRDV